MLEEDFKVVCPCCASKILIDHTTGAVVSHEEPQRGGGKVTFEQAVEQNQKRKSEAEDVFAQAVREEENKEELLEKKFREAFDKAEKDGSPPPHPFDYK